MSSRALRIYLPIFAAGLFAFAGSIETAEAQRSARPGQARVKPTRTQRQQHQVRRQAQPTRQARLRAPQRQRQQNNSPRLTSRDTQRLNRTASRFVQEIRAKFTPVVDLHFTQASTDAGVRFRKISDPRTGASGPTVIKVTGVEKAGGVVHMVMSGGASGHVMQPKYGGRPMSTVEQYGKSDTVHLNHKPPGASRSTSIIQAQSEGLVTQKPFSVKLTKGTHNFFYFRSNGGMGGSGGEGSEPELRQVQLIVE